MKPARIFELKMMVDVALENNITYKIEKGRFYIEEVVSEDNSMGWGELEEISDVIEWLDHINYMKEVA